MQLVEGAIAMHLMAHLALGIALLLVGYAGPSAAGKPADGDLAAIRMRKELGLSLKLERKFRARGISLIEIVLTIIGSAVELPTRGSRTINR
jgi:hypothetical protein